MNENSKNKETGPLILLFSPREEMRNILSAGLSLANYRILEATTSYIAGIKANQYLPDLVIVDITKNNIRDFLFLTRLERSSRTRNISIIISVTTEVHEALNKIREEIGSGEDGSNICILDYPFHFADLLKKIETLVHRKEEFKVKSETGKHNAIGERLFDAQVPILTKLREIESTLQKQWTFPFTVIKALDIVSTDGSCCQQLGSCIETDPAATSAVLRVANTIPFAKRDGRVSNVTEAVVRLGFNETRKLLNILALIELSPDLYRKYGFTRKDFWMHSLSTAVIAEQLCQDCGYSRPELAFISGLIHDVGKIPLDNNFSEVFARLLEETTNQITLFQKTETNRMGFSHADLGHYLTTQWNFPAPISAAILNHHDTDRILLSKMPDDRILQESIFTANIFAKALSLGHSCDEVLSEIPDTILKELAINGGPKKAFFENIQRTLLFFFEYLNLPKENFGGTDICPNAKDFEILLALGAQVDFHPIAIALEKNGFTLTTTKAFPDRVGEKVKAVIFIPDKGSPLDITVSGEETVDKAPDPYLKIFLLDGFDVKESKKEFTKSNIVLLDRRRLDLRLLLHVIEDYYYATLI